MEKNNIDNEENNSIANNTNSADDIEFDDNVDIDALQSQLQQNLDKSSASSETNMDILPDSRQMKDNTPDIELDDDVSAISNITEIQAKFEQFLTTQTTSSSPTINTLVEQIQTPVPVKSDVQNIVTAEQGDSPVVPDVLISALLNKPVKKPEAEKLQIKEGEKKYVIYVESDNIPYIESLSAKDRKKIINNILREQDIVSRKKRKIKEKVKFTNQVIIMVLTVVIALPVFFVLLNKSIEVTIINYQQAQQNFVKLYKEQGKIKSYKNFQNHFE